MISLHEQSYEERVQFLQKVLVDIQMDATFSRGAESLAQLGPGEEMHGWKNAASPCAFIIWRYLGKGEGEVISLALAHSLQGQGQMYSYLTSFFGAQQQVSKWWLEVHEANTPAIKLYHRLGFQVISHRKHYYPDQGNALVLCRQEQLEL